MSDLMYVQDAERPDLRTFAKLTQEDMRGYAFSKIIPVITVSEKGGKIWVAPKGATTAQGTKNRANGTALTGSEVKTVEVSYSCDRIEGRAPIYESEMHGFADENAAAQAGASAAGRQVLNSMEAIFNGVVFTSARTATELADHAVLKGLQTAAKKIRGYGKAALYMSSETFLTFVEIPEIADRFKQFAHTTGDVGYLATTNDQILASLSTMLGFDRIAIYDSDVVGATNDGKIAVVGVQPDAFGVSGDVARGIAKTKAMFGAAMVWVPAGAPSDEPFVMSQAADRANKCNYFDAEGWVALSNFVPATSDENGGAVVCKLAAKYTPMPAVMVSAS